MHVMREMKKQTTTAPLSVEWLPAHRTHAVLTRREPLVQTGCMEFVVASSARVFGQFLGGGVHGVVTDGTRIHTVQSTVKILL